MKRSESAQDGLDDDRNVDKPSDSQVSYLPNVGEYAKLGNKQKSREWRRKLRRKLEKSTEVQTFYIFPDNGLALFQHKPLEFLGRKAYDWDIDKQSLRKEQTYV